MYNEWGYNGKYKRTFDAKIGIRIKSKTFCYDAFDIGQRA